MTTIQISDAFGKRLSEMAKKNNLPESVYLEKMLVQIFEDQEDLEFALSRRNQDGPNISLEELEKEMNVSDETMDR